MKESLYYFNKVLAQYLNLPTKRWLVEDDADRGKISNEMKMSKKAE